MVRVCKGGDEIVAARDNFGLVICHSYSPSTTVTASNDIARLAGWEDESQ